MTLQSSSLPSLSFDLVEEILARIPATCLKRLRSRCKNLNVLFDDERFTKKHYDKAEKQFLAAMLRLHRVFSLRVNLRGHDNDIDSSIEVKGELILSDHCFRLDNTVLFDVFHCNGLLMCQAVTRLVVWNPCTGQTKWIKTEIEPCRTDIYALGCANNKSCYNYKILMFRDLESFDLEIYEFNSDSWSVLGNFTPDFKIYQAGVSLKGNTYWIASHKEVEELIYDFLISFDFTTERFSPRVCLPFKGYSFMDTISLSCVREERLSVFFQDKVTLKMEIWMSNNITHETEPMTWSQSFKIDLNTHRFGTAVSFIIDEEKKLIICCDEDEDDINDVVHIIGEDQYSRKVELEKSSFRPRLFTYVPSLVKI